MTVLEISGARIQKEVFFQAHPTLIKFPVDRLIKEVAFHQWEGTSTISCLITCHNGHEETEFARPRLNTRFDLNAGIEAAFMRCRDRLWSLLAYLEREGKTGV